ncbi:hypothetical protein EZS27_033832 [termite gut metagenome]|uniref:Transposase IS204/IS1001/IS1096/IS1165 DDE domain-containing protein n=1 Tax=termite gut metagenome TaxID=433724 RepID=A0A5J4Q4D4_9ZZZZ
MVIKLSQISNAREKGKFKNTTFHSLKEVENRLVEVINSLDKIHSNLSRFLIGLKLLFDSGLVLAWYDHHIFTGKIEGINNKIKTMKRQAYGYRDQEFFELKILGLQDKNYAFVG